ncbi:uncharacterized protein LOC143474584 [Brachyhypopomus gauderio]|uniref:uncharacterized protein LOC143474584 n=1 Tax=Brachyhypopomus gauderio TaxID=698409 RepID=UPI00404166DD
MNVILLINILKMLVHVCMVLLSLTHAGVLGLTVDQSELSLTKEAGKSAFISCTVTDLSDSNYVHWYQHKDGEVFKRILYVNKGGNIVTPDPNHPEGRDFTVKSNKQKGSYVLKVDTVKKSHSAVYYCACWDTSSHSDRNDSRPVQKPSRVLGLTVDQSELSLTKEAGKSAFISCKVTDLSDSNYVHWYQHKDGEAFKRILYVNAEGNSITPDPNHPEANEFTVKIDKKKGYYDLKVKTLRKSHSAVYYCACWDGHVAVLGVRVDQSDVSLTKEEGKSAFISCRVSDLRTTYIHWYQQKDGEPLKRILYISEAGGGVITDPNHPEANEFTVKPDKRISAFDLRVKTVKKSLAAVYYCACWESDTKPTMPVVSAYPVSTSQGDGKHTLLCQASGMFPDLVRFTWIKNGEENTKVPETDDELLEQRDEGQKVRVTSMLIINQRKAAGNKYTCKVKHEVKELTSEVPVDVAERADETDTGPVSTCAPPQRDEQNHVPGSLGRSQSLNLLRLTYVVLVLKNLLYFCFVSVLLYKRSAGNKESSSVSKCDSRYAYKVFGSGTRLIVTDAKPKKPVVLAYPIVSSKEDGKRILLCQASGMFPDLVRWEWKRKGKTGGGNAMVVPEADDELLEQKDEGQENRVTSMLIINQQKAADNNYTCKAKHEAVLGEESTVQVDMAKIQEVDTGPASTCAPPQGDQHNHVQGSLGRSQSLNLLRLTYVVLVLKNLLYFCFVSVLLYKRSAGNKESS